jgi:rhamnosyltransferase
VATFAGSRSQHKLEPDLTALWRVCGVIVAFHPDESFPARLLRIAGQVQTTVVIDNGSEPSIAERLNDPIRYGRVHVIRNSRNLGIAAALNIGLGYARSTNCTHALLFDQDTDPLPQLMTSIESCARSRVDIQDVAVIGINSVDAVRGKPLYPMTGRVCDEVYTVVSSGSLVSLAIADRLGPFREDFFIDLVDDEYCLRARSHGFKVLLIREPLAVHPLGSPKFVQLPWRTIGTSNHSALRRYYMIRNHLVVAREYMLREPQWVLRSLRTRLKSILLMLLLDDDRGSKVRFTWRGLIDGLARRTGEWRPGGEDR